MSETLKACPVPWCGYADPSFVFGPNEPDTYQIECEECGCTTPEYPTETAAIAAWNARAGGYEAVRETAITEAIQALIDASDYFSARADVNDGDYGVPSPNREMTLASQCDEALERLEALRARTQMERGK